MARVKGNVLAVRLAYLDEERTAEEKEAVLAAIPPETADALGQPIDPSAWYPFEYLTVLNRAIADHVDMEEEAALLDVGRFAAEVALAEVRDSIVARGSPLFLFLQAPTIWHQYYDSGRIEATSVTTKGGTFLVHDFDDPSKEHCISVRGWIDATIRLTGVDDVEVVERSCRCDGDDHCAYRCTWTPKTAG